MDFLAAVLKFNENFISGTTSDATSSLPYKKIVVLTCLEANLSALLSKATGLKNDQMHIIEIAGVKISNPNDSVMRSIILSICKQNAEEIWVIGHDGCSMENMDPSEILNNIIQERKQNTLLTLKDSGIDLEEWLNACGDEAENVRKSVETIRNHPLVPKNVLVHGLMMDQTSGKLNVIMRDEKEPR
ncbi:beta-class carbonic anhydrase [Laceyella putida]|uniref:carbonic anhydrase n=1 Tax=Laceyella putida TaxID=110101 RepID=A0ABW2RQC6_9BACL